MAGRHRSARNPDRTVRRRSTGLRLSFLLLAAWCGGALPRQASGNEPPIEFAGSLGTPGRLEDRVRFWVDVFTRWSVQQAIVQDRDRPWVVFAVVPGAAPRWARTKTQR